VSGHGWSRRIGWPFGALAASVLFLAVVVPASSFAGARVPGVTVATAPPGYQVVRTLFMAPPSMFDSGSQVACPAGTVVWGGGVENDFVNDTINTSAFLGSTAWQARVNNVDASTEGFTIDAVCANKPQLYKRVSHLVDDPAGAQTNGSATCPTGTVLLSGSVISFGDTTSVYLTSAWPSSSRKFTAYQENSSSTDQPFSVTALCAKKPAGYAIVNTTQSTSGVGFVEKQCPTGTSVLGGGIRVASPEPAVTLSASSVGDNSTTAWAGVVNNGSTTTAQVTGYSICAS
jgi:hypothetical protein